MNKKRRDFLKTTNRIALLSLGAFSFGYAVEPLVADKNKKIALIYATRYGATKDTAEWIKKGFGRDIELLNIKDISFENTAKEYDLFIIGSGVWIDGVDKDILKFLETQKQELKDKVIASFILCGTTGEDVDGEKRIEQYFKKFHAPLDKKPLLNEKFAGRMIIDKLNKKDKKLLETFYKRILKREFVSWDRTEPKRAEIFSKYVSKYV